VPSLTGPEPDQCWAFRGISLGEADRGVNRGTVLFAAPPASVAGRARRPL